MTWRVFRYVPFTVGQDESAEPTYEAECVSGDDSQCEAESGPQLTPDGVEEWMRKHAQETGHRRYFRIFSDYAVMEPPTGMGELVRANGGTA
ncbi:MULTISPECIES: hypothetical protein [Streptomyces]|uniref:DUF7848 domain-containing protein n=1 Tax=Streptomyces TaxID=1883 RepID=UPI00069AE9D6|nr:MULTISPECIES: hypothetical protein [Streptomyces]MYU57413.1 hypothetical protein [Streptomyces sp. SID7805]